MSSVAALQSELDEALDNIQTCDAALELDPNDEEAVAIREQCEQDANRLKARIAELKAEQSSTASSLPPPPPPSDIAPPPPPPTDESRASFKTGDVVLAKFTEDKQWYQASVIGKTGSSADPVYTVKFIGYGNKETKRKHEVRAIENKKRKAEAPPTASIPPAPSSPKPIMQDGAVISAAPSVDPSLVQKREPSKVGDGPTRMAPAPKKLKGNKALDKAKSSWKDWQKSGPKKPVVGATKSLHKESQFRTSDLPNAKVGFTGSGKPMQKDQARTKWTYGQVIEDPDD